MIEFAIGRYGRDEWRLIRYDGEEDEVESFDSKPDLADCLDALMDYHGTGSSPFSSRKAAVDANLLTNAWHIPTRNMEVGEENMPWDDPDTDSL